jgi:ribosomal protein S18 acetylase RimI-like enzyme
MARIDVLDHRDPAVAAQVVGVQRAAYAVEARLIGFDGIPPLHECVTEVVALDLALLAAVEHGRPIALLGYRRAGTDVEIDRLAVHPDHFRHGLARRLITELHAREVDATRFHVSTGRDNRPAIALYQSHGYELDGDVVLPQGVVIARLVRECSTTNPLLRGESGRLAIDL